MIQPLRIIHRRAFVASAVVLPIIFISGIASRQALPEAPAIPSQTPSLTKPSEHSFSAGRVKLTARVFKDSGTLTLQISTATPFLAPDVLVYFSSNPPDQAPASDAVFLGIFTPGQLYRLPKNRSGNVTLYSLAEKQILASFSVGDSQ
jgi:hypothetical protein